MIRSSSPHPSSRSRTVMIRLLSGGGVVTLAATLASLSSRGDAQIGFQGNFTVSVGGSEVLVDGPRDSIHLNNVSMGVIDWVPYDQTGSGNIDFLPANGAVNFNGNSSNFTVLNRINPINAVTGAQVFNRIIELNGAITSSPGGRIWFYTPGGFLVGSTASIDVGSLVLATSAIDPANLFSGTNGTINFTGVANSASSITIAPGAQINALTNGSYVALVAPRIVQGGSVNVDGSVAYVGGEAAQIVMNAGLFDINITTGTDDAHGVQHTGTTAGPATQSDRANTVYDHQRIYMTALPKNNALTMLLSGDIGYTAAASANEESGVVILGAGYTALVGSDPNDQILSPYSNTPVDAGFSINGGATFTSSVYAASAADIVIQPAAAGSVRFEGPSTPIGSGSFYVGSALLSADGSIAINLGTNQSLYSAGDLFLLSGSGVTGGNIAISVSGTNSPGPSAGFLAGSVNVVGGLVLDAAAFGDPDFGTTPITGGSISLSASGDGSIAAGLLNARASASDNLSLPNAANAVGGSIALTTTGNGLIRFLNGGFFDVSASATDPQLGLPTQGGDATGGSVSFTATGGSQQLGGVNIDASATGDHSSGGPAGDATGGSFTVDYTGGTHSWDNLYTTVESIGGAATGAFADGAARPGSIDIAVSGATTSLNVANSVTLQASSFSQTGGTAGSLLEGGTIDFIVSGGASVDILAGFIVDASAEAFRLNATDPASSTSAQAGDITILARGGTLNIGFVNARSNASAGDATGTAGNAFAGTVTFASETVGANEGVLTFNNLCNSGGCASSSLSANAFGASGTQGTNATGGTVSVYTRDGALSGQGTLEVQAAAQAGYSISGANGRSGDAQGGSITVETRTGQTNDGALTFGDLVTSATGTALINGEGPEYNRGNGGVGTGGTVNVNLPVGTLAANSVALQSEGDGAAAAARASGAAYVAGDGIGGTTRMTLNGGAATIGSLGMTANGFGGVAESGHASSGRPIGGIAGAGRGGIVELVGNTGSLTVTTLTMSANGNTYGSGLYPGVTTAIDANASNGGAGFGGAVTLNLPGSSNATINAGTINLDAIGLGGDGGNVTTNFSVPPTFAAGNGGIGTGGSVDVDLAGGALTVTGAITTNAAGIGGRGGINATLGNGGAGGGGIGGSTIFSFISLNHAISAINLAASGTGGTGGSANLSGAGGSGGDGTGGLALFKLGQDPTLDNLTILANGSGGAGGNGATGGVGGNGQGGIGANGAYLTVGFGALTVTGTTQVGATGVGGVGGSGFTGQGGMGGAGQGGSSGVTVDGVFSQLVTNMANYHAVGRGGDGGASGVQGGDGITGASGGNGVGGSVTVSVVNGANYTLGNNSAGGFTALTADGIGGNGALGALGSAAAADGGDGGNGGGGGSTYVEVLNGASISRTVDSQINQNSYGRGGTGAAGLGATGQGGTGGEGLGGSARALIENASVDVNDWFFTAEAFGGRGGGVPVTAGAASGLGGAGGIALGGQTNLTLTDATLNAVEIELSGEAIGGDGGRGLTGGRGGDGVADSAAANFIVSGTASNISIDTLTLYGTAEGGDGGLSTGNGASGARGGDAYSGLISADIADTIINFGTELSLVATALGGQGSAGSLGSAAGANGGDGGLAGGFPSSFPIAAVQLTVGPDAGINGNAQINLATGSAGGQGGLSSGNGVAGAGGDATTNGVGFTLNGGTIQAQELNILAVGVGGFGGNTASATGQGGASGNGTGADVALTIDNGGLLLNGALNMNSGGLALNAGRNANGGNTQAGNILLDVTGPDSFLSANGMSLLARAQAAAAGAVSGNPDTDGALGGAANGGIINVNLADGSITNFTGTVELIADATGGAGTAGSAGVNGGTGGDGGDAQAGTVTFALADARLDASGVSGFTISADATGGIAGNGGAASAVTGGNGGNGGEARAGAVAFSASNGDYDIGSLTLNARSTPGLGGQGGLGTQIPGNPSANPPVPPTGPFFGNFGSMGESIAGSASFSNSDDGTLAVGAVRRIGGLFLESSADYGDFSNLVAGGLASFSDTATAIGGGVDLMDAQVIMTSRGFGQSYQSSGISFTRSGGPTTINGLIMNSDTGISVAQDGPTSILTVNGQFYAFAGGSDLLFNHANSPTGGGPTVKTGQLDFYANGSLTADAGVRFSADNPSTIVTGGDITIPSFTAGSSLLLQSFGGSVFVDNNLLAQGLVTALGDTIDIRSQGSIGFDQVTAASDFRLEADGTARFRSDVTAANITVSSSDIDIDFEVASLRASGFLSLTNNDSSRVTYVGGENVVTGYSLSNDEIGALFAPEISVFGAPPIGSVSLGSSAQPDVVIGDVTLTAGTSGNLTPDGRFGVFTAGKMRVQGAMTLTGADANGGISLFADDALEVIAGQGSIDIRDDNNALSGRLELFSEDIIAATLPTIGTVAAATSIAQRDALLSVRDANVAASDDGYFRAGNIEFNVISGLYIQNSGAGTGFDDRRGFTARTVFITTEQPDAQIIVNGRLIDSLTGFATGIPVIGRLDINDGTPPNVSGFAAASTANGCTILNTSQCGERETEIETGDLPDEVERIEAPIELGTPDKLLPTVLFEMQEQETIGFPPLIDEPVTGAGNEDLWELECTAQGENKCN